VTLGRALAKATVRALDAARAHAALASATQVGKGVRVLGWPSVASEGELVVERGVVIVASPSPVEILVARGARLVIGAGSVLESGATLRARSRLILGRGVRVGAGSVIDDDAQDAGGIEIGDDAWLEDGALVVGGERIKAHSRVKRPTALGDERTKIAERTSSDAVRDPLRSADDAQLRRVVARIVPGALGASSETDLRTIAGWDSLAALRVLVALEKEFRVGLPQDLFATARSLESVLPLLVPRRDAS
jgi:acyl carrier protein/acetyltransferase-like isoleucine patch superfamily enzyme